jgi:hypothetical protein
MIADSFETTVAEDAMVDAVPPGRLAVMTLLWLLSFFVLLPFVSNEWKRTATFPEDRFLSQAPPPSLEALRERHEYLLDRLFARHEIVEQSSPIVWNWRNKTSGAPAFQTDSDHFWEGGREDFDHATARHWLSRIFMTPVWSRRLRDGLYGFPSDPTATFFSLEVTAVDGARLEYIHTRSCWQGKCQALPDRTLGIIRAILETNQEAIRIYGERPWPITY